MTIVDLAQVAAALAPATIALARAWQINGRVRALEESRTSTGVRVGVVEKLCDYNSGRIDELSKRAWER